MQGRLDGQLVGVVAGFYPDCPRDHDPEGYDWAGWDFREEILAARRRMKALRAMLGQG
jgi:hypothetical protein